ERGEVRPIALVRPARHQEIGLECHRRLVDGGRGYELDVLPAIPTRAHQPHGERRRRDHLSGPFDPVHLSGPYGSVGFRASKDGEQRCEPKTTHKILQMMFLKSYSSGSGSASTLLELQVRHLAASHRMVV